MQQCDDMNNVDGDGCTSNCQIEDGWTCIGGNENTRDVCVEICGDGKLLGFYPCDDGNVVTGDGCNDICKVEAGWTCSGGNSTDPSVC